MNARGTNAATISWDNKFSNPFFTCWPTPKPPFRNPQLCRSSKLQFRLVAQPSDSGTERAICISANKGLCPRCARYQLAIAMVAAKASALKRSKKTINMSFACAVKRARHSSGRRISHPATVAPAGSNRSVRSGQLLRTKSSVKKVAEKATSERAGHNMSERRASLEKGNVNAELVRNKRRPRDTGVLAMACAQRRDASTREARCVEKGRLNRRPVRESPGRIGWRRGP